MEKILYSRKGKALFIMLQNMCIIAVTACILTVIFFSNMNDADRQGNLYGTHSVAYNGIGIGESVTDFEESIGFSNMLYDSVNEIARFAVIREQMEKDGDFDGSKKIDIVQFANRYSQLDQESNVSYYLEDLIKWGQYGLFM